ncbi:MAG TPA: alpha/beta hydrolase [Ktedonobacterales bacterium]|jgi:pimeloyl-ACP methyl ester carboxylesterase|nr:alpha/beta hydrolase [Ktedonobacterales bacterium]
MSTGDTQHDTIQTGRVTTEGDELYYEVRGQGPPLLLIPPAGGDGWLYASIAELLADTYKVITYDRRANARSTGHAPQNFEISQQSRDAVAVLRAVGEPSAFVVGNSSGAVIALDMAKTQPQAVRAVVAHEPPLARLHPQAKKWQRFFARVYLTALRFGPTPAAVRFILGIQVPVRRLIAANREVTRHRQQSGEPYISAKEGIDVLLKQELLGVTNYLPDVELIKQNEVRAFIAVGEWAQRRQTWFALTTHILADQLGCELVTFPGHHAAFMDMPMEWATTLRRVLHKAAQ